MSGWILFAIAMVSLAAILIGLMIVVIVGLRLAKHGGRFVGNVSRATEPMMRGANEAAAKAAEIGAAAQTISANLARLQIARARLDVLNNALRDGLKPWRKARSYVGL